MTFLKDIVHSPKSSPEKELPLKGKRILLAEDSPDNQCIIDHYLTLNGAKVSLANDGGEAVIKAIKGKFDLILMDIQMPNMNGISATGLLKQLGYKIPIIALTAFAPSSDSAKDKRRGFAGHLCKPFCFPDLLEVILAHDKKSLKKSVRKKAESSPRKIKSTL